MIPVWYATFILDFIYNVVVVVLHGGLVACRDQAQLPTPWYGSSNAGGGLGLSWGPTLRVQSWVGVPKSVTKRNVRRAYFKKTEQTLIKLETKCGINRYEDVFPSSDFS